jgi:predicted metalloprotease with PDZ domain
MGSLLRSSFLSSRTQESSPAAAEFISCLSLRLAGALLLACIPGFVSAQQEFFLKNGDSVVTAMRGNLGVPDTEIRSRILETIRLERDFWKDDRFPYYLVAVLPFDQGQGSTGGDGFTNAFSLHLSPQRGVSQSVLSLLAHEVLHEWNPYRIGLMPEPAEGIYWFTEGFTMYYRPVVVARQADFVPAISRFAESRAARILLTTGKESFPQ